MNLANVLTPGYKRGVALQRVQGANFTEHLGQAAFTTPSFAAGGAPIVDLVRSGRAGTLKSTGQSLDVALAGQGYFEVATDAGPAYTRNGGFRLDARARLVTAQGYPVMGTGGEIVLDVANPVIGASGAITSTASDGNPLGQLKVVDFESHSTLTPMGDGLHAAAPGMKVLPPDEVLVRQGFLENSNVSSTEEMNSMIQAMRHFESMQKIAQGYDEMLGTAIRKLGETS